MPLPVRQPPYKFHDDCERNVYVNWINKNLFSNDMVSSYLPINPNGEGIFDQASDGIVLTSILMALFPNCIDTKVLKTGPQTSRLDKVKNLNLAYETARSFGCEVYDLRLFDIYSGVRQSVLEMCWQIFNAGIINVINYENNPEISVLKEDLERDEVIECWKPLEIVIRYANYLIWKHFSQGPLLKTIDESLNDGSLYIYLLSAVALERNFDLIYSLQEMLRERDVVARFDMLRENFTVCNLSGFLTDDIVKSYCTANASHKMHQLTLANIFLKFPLIEYTNPLSCASDFAVIKQLRKQTNLEKLCKSFMNFLGVKPIVTNIACDCEDGLIVIQLLEIIENHLFRNDDIFTTFSSQRESEKVHNACVILNKFCKFYSMHIDDLHPEYMARGDVDLWCAIIYNIMLYWIVNGNKKEDEAPEKFNKKELINWVNSFEFDGEINSFRDMQIDFKHVLIKVIDKLFPQAVDMEYYNKLTTLIDRLVYCTSVARREGCPFFVNPRVLATGDHYSYMLAFALLRYRAYDRLSQMRETVSNCSV